MVLRRTVCGQRPWSEALVGGGPSIPLPSTRKEESPSPPGARYSLVRCALEGFDNPSVEALSSRRRGDRDRAMQLRVHPEP